MKSTTLLIWAALVVGCASKEKKEVGHPLAAKGIQWETKAQVRDYRNNKTNNLNIDIIAVKNSYLRMEISATLGYPVASYVSAPQAVRMAIYTQKKFYYGPNSEELMRGLLGFPLSPEVFQNIVFDAPIRGWKCENGSDGFVAACKRATKDGDVVVAWQDRKENSKRVIIQGPQFEMEWQFKDFSPVDSIKPDTFKLEAPAGYKIIPVGK